MSDAASIDVLSNSAGLRLRTIIERVERLEAEKEAILSDIKEVFAEAKGEGFDTKILRKVVRLRKMDAGKRQEEEALLDLYLSALEGTPLSAESAITVAATLTEATVAALAATRKPAPDSVAVASINGRNAVKEAQAEHRPVAPNPYDRGTPQHRVWAEAARDEALKLGVEL
jgi:uncharacterized protein (UPF0335 family)